MLVKSSSVIGFSRLFLPPFCFYILLASIAHAEDAAYGIQLTPFAGYRFGGEFEDGETGETFEVDDETSYGLIVNYPYTSYTEWELYYSQQSTSVDAAGFIDTDNRFDLDIDYLQIGGTYLFEATPSAVPYFVATVGLTKIDPDLEGASSDNFLSFGVGGGWKFFPTSRVGLRLDGRFLGTFIDSDSKIFCQSGQEGGGCAVALKGDLMYQFEMQAGLIVRF
jgi:opacity protein-like surface antigen